MKKLTLSFILLLVCLFPTFAQDDYTLQRGSYIRINGGGGISSFLYSGAGSDIVNKFGFGYKANLEYTYFFTPNVGLGIGAGVRSISSSSTISGYDTYTNQATEALTYQSYQHTASYNDIKETYNAHLLDVPLGVYFQGALGRRGRVMFGIGGKFSMPITSFQQTYEGSVTTSGYFEEMNWTAINLPEYGFTTTEISRENKDAKLKYIGSLFAELDFMYAITPRVDFLIGIYADYGLNNHIEKANDADATKNFNYNSDNKYIGLLASNKTGNITSLTAGLQLGFRFRLSNSGGSGKKVTATVIEKNTKSAIPGANVAIYNDKDSMLYKLTSNNKGKAITRLKPGTYRFETTKDNFVDVIESQIIEKKKVDMTVEMLPWPNLTFSIIDKETKEPISEGTILMTMQSDENRTYRQTANDQGKAIIKNVKPGAYTLTANAAGYEEYKYEMSELPIDSFRIQMSLPKAKIHMVIKDTKGYPIPMAKVTLTNKETGEITVLTADEQGILDGAVFKGPYDMTIEKEGYKTMEQYINISKDISSSLEMTTEPQFIGIVKNARKGNFVDAVVRFKNKETNKVYVGQSNEDGVLKIYLPQGRYQIAILREGYMPFNKDIEAVSNGKRIVLPLIPAVKNAKIALKNIEFETNSTRLAESSDEGLEELVSFLNMNPELKVEVSGHTDNRGKAAFNLKLSQGRAKSVVKALEEKGIEKSRIISKGFGSKKPVASNKTAAGRAKNRRVEMKII